METLNRIRPAYSVSLRDEVGGTDAWGTELGAHVFAKLNLNLLGLSEGTLVPIDYAGVSRCDSSFQREAVVETLRKHRPRLLFFARGLADPDVRANLQLALERRGDALLVAGGEHPNIVGKRLSRDLLRTLEIVSVSGEMTSSRLREAENDLELTTASSRLTALWRAGLVERVDGTSLSGGREHRYYPIISRDG